MGTLTKSASSNIRIARQLHQRITEQVIDPMRQAGMDDPNVTRSTARIYLETALDKALKDNMGGPPVTVGAKFAVKVAGTPQAKANLNAILESVARANKVSPGEYRTGWQKLVEVLSRTARIPGAGSPTAQRQELARQAADPSFVGKAADALNLTKGSVLGQIADRSREASQGRNYEMLARIFTDPNSVDIIRRLARTKPDSIAAQYLLAELMGLSGQGGDTPNDAGNDQTVNQAN